MAGRERKRGLSESSEEEGTLEKVSYFGVLAPCKVIHAIFQVARLDVVANDLATSGSSSGL